MATTSALAGTGWSANASRSSSSTNTPSGARRAAPRSGTGRRRTWSYFVDRELPVHNTSRTIPADSETAAEMVEAIMGKAFPAVQRVIKTAEETIPEDKMREAVREELDVLLKASWQHQQTKHRADPESRLAAVMGTSPRLIAHWKKLGDVAEERARQTPPPKKPTRRSGKRKPTKSR
jgi:hypothetical protein